MCSIDCGVAASRGPSSGAGFTIVELLVSGLVLSIAIIGVAMMFGQVQIYLAAEVDDRIGIGLVRQKIEALRGLGFDCIPVGNGNEPRADEPLPLGSSSCQDLPGTQAARIYNEDETDRPPGDPDSTLGFYARRVTTVTCVDQEGFPSGEEEPLDEIPFANECPAPVAKRIIVELTPRTDTARAIRVETLLTRH